MMVFLEWWGTPFEQRPGRITHDTGNRVEGMKVSRILANIVFGLALAGCATSATMIEKRNLDVQTLMSDTIFLDPTSPANQKIYIQIRNTSDKPDFVIKDQVAAAIQAHGWTVVSDPAQANYMLQANILSVGKMDPSAAKMAMKNGYGGVLGSAAVGAGVAAVAGGNGRTVGGVGLAVGAADFVGGLLVKDVYFAAISDVQLSQRTRPGQKVKVQGSQDLKQGTSGGEYQSYQEDSDWKRYRTRVLSSANKANLEWTEAQPALVGGLAQVIGGLF